MADEITLQPVGPPGAPGNKLLEFKEFPLDDTFGVNGDWAIYTGNTYRYMIFGPKVAGKWPKDGVKLNGPPGRDGVGAQGQAAWSPVWAVAEDGTRRVLQIVDWTGGEGTKPPVNQYLGPTGLTTIIGNATNVRGTAGVDGTGTGDVVGPASVTDSHIAQFDGTTGKLLKQIGPSNLADLVEPYLGIVEPGIVLLARTVAVPGSAYVELGSATSPNGLQDLYPGYNDFMLELEDLQPSVANDPVSIRLGNYTDGLLLGATDYRFTRESWNTDGVANLTVHAGTSALNMTGQISNSIVQRTGWGRVWTKGFGPSGARGRWLFWDFGLEIDSTNVMYYIRGAGQAVNKQGPINLIRIYFNTGNITRGTFKLFGVKSTP